MRKITFLVAVMMLIGSMAFSQIEATHLKLVGGFPAKKSIVTNHKAATCDTIVPLSFMTGVCYDSLGEYTAASTLDSGYFTGENYYNFAAYAMKYTATVNATISDVYVMFGAKAGVTGNTSVSIYTATGTGSAIKPGTSLGTSAIKIKGAIDTTNYGLNFNNDYHFSTPVTLTTATYFVVLTIPTNFVPTVASSDTNALAIMDMAANTCNAVDSDGFFKYGTTWYSIVAGVGMNLDMMIFPYVCSSTVGVQEYAAKSMLDLFPNPSFNIVNVVSSQNIESVKIIILLDRQFTKIMLVQLMLKLAQLI